MARRPGLRAVPLTEVRRKVAAERAEQRDLYAPLSKVRLDLGETPGPLPDRFRVYVEDGERGIESCRLTATALGQFCNLAGVPFSFLEKLPTSLALKVLRCMVEVGGPSDGRPRLFRLKGEGSPKLRAVLPQSYVRLDDLEVLDEVDQAVAGEDIRVVSFTVGDDALHLRLVFRDVLDLGPSGRSDPAWPGVDIMTSETGQHALEVRHVVWRQICSNGVTSVTAEHQTLSTRYTRFDRAALRESLTAALNSAVHAGLETAGTLRETRGATLVDPRAEIEHIMRTYRLGSPRGRIGRWVAEELTRTIDLFGCSRFDLVQAFTATARGLAHRDRMKLEDAMGSYLVDPTRN